jgi:hypothetical protein
MEMPMIGKRVLWISLALSSVTTQLVQAMETRELTEAGMAAVLEPAAIPKSASARTVGARAAAASTITIYGGFELASSSLVYLLVRGNSLGSLGITQAYLDRPRVRLYNAAGQDLYTTNGYGGWNFCSTSRADDLPVINYYQTRGIPVSENDACLAVALTAGAYTFTVTPSIIGVTTAGTSSVPPLGEALFEVKLGP